MTKTKKHLKVYSLLLFVASLMASALTASAADVNARFITMKDGLNNNTVRNIVQDSKGFVWMATHNGLVRYDGVHFVNIVPDPKANVTLADRKVNGVKEDAYRHLWIATAQNVFSCYDLETEKFVDFTGCGEYNTHYKKMEFIDNDIWLWGDEGCRRVTFADGKFASQTLATGNGKNIVKKVRRVEKTPAGIMVGSEDGLFLWQNGNVTKIDSNRKVMWIAAFGKDILLVDTDGNLFKFINKKIKGIGRIDGVKSSYDIPGAIALNNRWIVFTANGGYSVDPKTNKIERVKGELDIVNALVNTDNVGDYWLFNGTGKVKYVERKSGRVRTFTLMDSETLKNTDSERYVMVNDGQGTVWITTYGCGLYAYDKTHDQLTRYTADNTQSALIATNSLLCAMQDKSGNIWIGSWLAGVSLLHPTDSRIFVKSTAQMGGTVRMINKVGNEVWIANTKGSTIKGNGNLSQSQPYDCGGVNIYAVCRDSQGTLWLGSRKYGVKIGDEWYRYDNNDNASLPNNSVFDIHRDSRGRMWVGTFGGGLCLAVKGSNGKYTFRTFFNDNYGTQRIRCISEDRAGWLWVGTSGGLIVFNPDQLIANPKAYHIYNTENGKLRNNEVRSIMRDSKGRMWVAETGEGFSVFTPGKDYANISRRQYSTADGLVNGMVQSFAEDARGRVWIATEYGMSCYNPQSSSFRNFFFASTIAGNGYTENCAVRLADGRLAFGTNEGLAIVDPRRIAESKDAARVTFTELRINGAKIEKDSENIGLPYTKEITLDHNQNSIEIYFSTLDFASSSQTQYSYKLEGYDDDWSNPSSLNFAAYKNLEPGTYTLLVRATNIDGVWSEKASSIVITVEPPLWATPWAYLLYLLLAAAIAYVVVKTLKKMDSLRMQVKVEEKMADYKLTFFTNISHEFRTPLTLIGASLDRMKRSIDNSTERKSALAMMDKSVARMGRLINELLEFHKAQKGKLTLGVEPTEVVGLLRNYYEAFADFAVAKQMDYKFEPQIKYLNIPIDRDKLDKIVYNLLSNAFKYTNSGGTIVLSVSLDDSQEKLVISVSDNGIGVKPEERAKLFDRFAVGNVKRGSMGIGLHLVSGLVEVHKGTITYSENPTGGSIFTVVLPASEKAYSEEEYLKGSSSQSTCSPSPSLPQGEGEAPSNLPPRGRLLAADGNQAPSPWGRAGEGLVDGLGPSSPLNSRTVLVIEDDNDVRQILVEELSPYVTVVARPDGESGYDYARENDVDLILCDVMMPGMDGFEVTSRLKGSFATSHIPVILLTALSADESKLRGAQCGADNYITKPFSTQLLLTKVLKTIEQRDKLKEKFSKDVTAVRPLISTSDKDKAFVDKLTEVISANLANPDFSIDDFADAMALGRTILFRKIKGVTGYSPKEYLRVMRMKKAAELLVQPDMNVSEVAYAVGLSDPFYFSKCFKQQFGMPPSEYKSKASIIH